MKSLLCKVAMAAIVMFGGIAHADAQGFLKKLQKGVESTLSKKTDDSAEKQADTDSISKEDLLSDIPNFEYTRIIELDDKGDTIRNEDGTVRYYYHVWNVNTGEVCSDSAAMAIVNKRLKSYAMVLAKVGGGALAGGATALLAGGKKKEALLGAAAGAIVGLGLSAKDIKKIKAMNKDLKEMKKVLSIFHKTFTEEGLPVDANVDVSDVDGLNFNESSVRVMAQADVKKDLDKSKADGNLDNVDFDKL